MRWNFKFLTAFFIFTVICLFTAGCITEDTNNTENTMNTNNADAPVTKEMQDLSWLYVPASLGYNLTGNYSVISFVGYSEDIGFSYEAFDDEIKISDQYDRLFKLTDNCGKSYYAVYDKDKRLISSDSAKNSSDPWQTHCCILSDSEIRMAFAGRINGSLYADGYNLVKECKEPSILSVPNLTGIWDIAKSESGSKNMTVEKMNGPVFYGSFCQTDNNLMNEYDFVASIFDGDENSVSAVCYDEKGDFGRIEVSEGKFVINRICEDGIFSDVYLKRGESKPDLNFAEVTDISGIYQDMYYFGVLDDGIEKNYYDYLNYSWSLRKSGTGNYIIESTGIDTGFLHQYPDNSVFYRHNGHYSNGWIEKDTIYSFFADEDSAEMYVSKRR